MTLFQLVKIALDELYKETVSHYGSEADADKYITQRFSYLRSSYEGLVSTTRQPIDYRDPATRFAYVYKYVASHGDYMVQILKKLQLKEGRVFHDSLARVSCIGGGPGSDVIAVLKYLADHRDEDPVSKLTVYLLDKEQAWADSWTELDSKLDVDVKLSTVFQPLDVTDPASWSSQRRFLDADIFTMSYFVSEVYAFDSSGAVTQFWQTLFQGAKSGAKFIYVDNGSDTFNNYFDQLWQGVGLLPIIQGTNEKWFPQSSEQKSELAKYTVKFGEIPKVQAYLSYRVLRKP